MNSCLFDLRAATRALLHRRTLSAARSFLLAAPLLGLLSGCYTLGIDHTRPGRSERESLSAGYAVVHELLQGQKTANQVTRLVPANIQQALDGIAGSALEFDDTITGYADQNHWIDLDRTELPDPVHDATRLQGQEDRTELLRLSGRPYERMILLIQWEILGRQENLARAMALLEPDPKRKAFWTLVTARTMAQRTAVLSQLDLRYFSPG